MDRVATQFVEVGIDHLGIGDFTCIVDTISPIFDLQFIDREVGYILPDENGMIGLIAIQ